MSENLDFVRSIYADWERGDFSRADWADPEIEYSLVGDLDEGTVRGLAGMAQVWGRWLSAWDNVHVEPESFLGRRRIPEPELLRLQAAGVPVAVVRHGDDLATVLHGASAAEPARA